MKDEITSHGMLTPLDRQGNTIHQCCQCKRVRDVNGVYSYRLFGNRVVSHGYCTKCHDQIINSLKGAYNETKKFTANREDFTV